MSINRRAFLKGGLLVTTGVAAASALGGCSQKTNDSSTDSGTSTTSTSSEETWYGAPANPESFDIVEVVDVDLLICGYGSAGLMATAVAAQQGINAVTIEKAATGSNPKGLGVIGASIDKDYISKGWLTAAVDPIAVMNEVARYASGWGDPCVIKTWATESGSTFDWISDNIEGYGARPFFEYDVADGTHGIWKVMPIEHYFHIDYTPEVLAEAEAAVAKTGNPAASVGILPTWGDFLRQQTEDVWGANVRCSTALVQLLQDDSGRVTGAIAKGKDGYIQFNASKAVILATGGYEANTDLLKLLNPDSERVCGFPMYNSYDTGDGIKAGIWAGGVKDKIPTLMTFARAAIAPDAQLGYPYTGTTCWMGDQPFPKVNLDGVRVCCETTPYDYPLHVASKQRENKLFSIWDANYEKHIAQFHTIGCSRIMPTTTTMLDGTSIAGDGGLGGWGVNESIIASAIDAGVIQTADTLQELATKMGVNSENLKATIENYNKMAAAGVDTEFGKPANDLIALDTPPYYGCAFGGHILVTLDGLQIDKDMRVLDGENVPIEGLYACGNCSGSFYAGTYPELFISNAMGRTVTFARHAVLHIKDNL
jgi:fumarate reductase flavoprotein subunit